MRGTPGPIGLAVLFGALLAAGCGSTPPSPSPTSSGGPPSLSPTVRPTPTAAPTPTPEVPVGEVLPTPTTTDVVLLVADGNALSPREQQWLTDLLADFGRVDAVNYSEATLERLDDYFTVFVIDQSADLDVAALASAFQSGLTVHLIGAAAGYQAQVAGGPR